MRVEGNSLNNSLRLSSHESTYSSSQLRMDSLYSSFSEQASDLRSLAAMSVGSLAFSSVRLLGTPLLSTLFRSSSIVGAGTWTTALMGEVAAFRATNQVLSQGHVESWYDYRAFAGTAMDFALLKGFSHFFHSEAFVFRHGVSATAMLSGELLRERLHWSETSNQSLLDRFVHAVVSSVALETASHVGRIVIGGRLESLGRSIEGAIETHEEFESQILEPQSSALHSMSAGEASISGLDSTQRRERYQSYVENGADLITHQLESYRDRGLIVSPVGSRDMLGEFIERELTREERHSALRHLSNRNVMIVVQGNENFERWQRRLDRIFETENIVGADSKRSLWERNGLRVQIASIHSLSRLRSDVLRKTMDEAGMVVLDKEHHIRAIEDEAGPERSRFMRVLVQAGFLTEEFELRANPTQFLLGLTETVTEGAGRIYGGREGLILARSLPELKREGMVNSPEVRVIRPQGSDPNKSVHEIWSELELNGRVEHSFQIIQALEKEWEGREKPPRIVLYAGSREEAIALTRRLEQESNYQNEVALLISGEGEIIQRRERSRRIFF